MADEPTDIPAGAVDWRTAPVAPASPGSDVSAIESFGRGAVEGATFGFDDKLGFDKDRREQSRKANPWTHFAGELVGGVAPMVASGGVGAGVRAGAAAANAAGLTGVARAGTGVARGIEAAMLPGEIKGAGSAALQGAKLGATYGGLSGAGHADVDETDTTAQALAKRGSGALTGAGVGTIVGAPLGVAGHAIGRAAQNMMGARAAANAETADATAGSLMALGRGMERDRITPDDIIANIRSQFPDDTATAGGKRYWGASSARQPWTADDVEQVVRRALNGHSADDISNAMRASGSGPGPAAVKTLLDELAARQLGPLNIVDRASMIRTGSGDNTQMTLRAAAATPGRARADARENLLERQIGSQGRLRNAFERIIGSADYDGVAARHGENLQQAGSQAYGAAFAAEQPFSITPIFFNWEQRYAGKPGPVPEGITAALNDMKSKVPGGPAAGNQVTLWAPQNLEGYINARQNLQQRISDAKPGSPLHRSLVLLKRELDTEVGNTNPLWKVANDIWRDGKAAEDAMEAGARQALRLNSASRENLSEYTDARALVQRGKDQVAAAKKAGQPTTDGDALIAAGRARQDLFRVGLVRSLNDMLANQGETHNVTRVLRLPAARKTIETVLGPDDAARLYAVIDAEHAMNRTYASQFGSQTTPLKEAIDDLNWAPRTRSWLEMMNPRRAMEAAGEWVAARINADRNQKMMPMLTETNPVKQLDLMRSLGQVAQARQVGDQVVRRPAVAAAGPVADATAAEMLPKPKSAESKLLSQARNALLRGASRADVEQRLRDNGVDPAKLEIRRASGGGIDDSDASIDVRPASAFDADGKPRVPASGGSERYPNYRVEDVTASDAEWRQLRNRILGDPGGALVGGLQRAGDAAAATAATSGPQGAIVGTIARMFRNPKLFDPVSRSAGAREATARQAEEALAAASAARSADRAKAGLQAFEEGIGAKGAPMLSHERGAATAALDTKGWAKQPLRDEAGRSSRYGAVDPSADPASIERALREAAVAGRQQFRETARTADDLAGAARWRAQVGADVQVDEVAQRLLAVAADRLGSSVPDKLAQIPRGQYERLLANEGLGPYLELSGRTMDDVVQSMLRQGYALRPFNANSMQIRDPGTGRIRPMSDAEKEFRNAIWHATNVKRRGGEGLTGAD